MAKLLRDGRLALLALVSVVLAGAAPQATVHEPTGGWNVDYGETQCFAMRKFGPADDSWLLAIRPAFNRESFEFLISREGSGPSSVEEEAGSVDLGNGAIKTRVLLYKTPGTRMSVQRYRIKADELRAAIAARTLTFTIGAKSRQFAVGGLAPIVAALDTCLADLRRHWNAEVVAPTVAKSAIGDLRSLFTSDDYPAIALLEGREGAATFMLLVDEKGKVAGCDLVVPSGVPILDVMGCEVFRKRAKFDPARNAAGQPVRDTVVSPPVRWRIG